MVITTNTVTDVEYYRMDEFVTVSKTFYTKACIIM